MNKMTHQVLVTVGPSKELLRQLKKQARSNSVFKALAVIGIGCAIWSEIGRRKQEEEIYQLTVRVKKLERNGEE